MKTFQRTCQECGHEQKDKEPPVGVNPTIAYLNRKCKKCGSMGLDFGSYSDPDEKEPFGEGDEPDTEAGGF